MEPADPPRPADPALPPAEVPPEQPSHWAPSESAHRRAGRVVPLWLVWLVALALAGFNGFLAARLVYGNSDSGRAFGYVVGTVIGPFLIALIARTILIVIRSRRQTGSRSILRSRWVPIGATILAGVSLATNIVSAAPLRPADPSSAMRISGPFTLREASPETTRIAEAGFKGDRTIRSYAVREVVGEDGSLSLLVVADGPMNDRVGAIESVARGIESASGLTATIEPIRGRNVTIAVGETLSIGAWIEEPLGFFVYAVTPTRLHQIIEAVLDAPR
jgi:hypothetical protein